MVSAFPMRILIVHTWGIGDWLFFSPVLKALRVRYPSAEISVLLGTSGTEQIVRLYSEVDALLFANVRRGYHTLVRPVLRIWEGKPDLVIFTAGVDSRRADLFSAMIPRSVRFALRTHDHRPLFLTNWKDFKEDVHMVDNNGLFFELLDLPKPVVLQPWMPRPKGITPQTGSVLIHPGSAAKYAFKRWPVGQFKILVELLLTEGRCVTVVLGPEERELADSFLVFRERVGFRLEVDLVFQELVELIALHPILINCDSGLGHLAAALDVNVLSIFGPSVVSKVRPYGTQHRQVISGANLPCMPCIRRGGRYGCEEKPCLLAIPVEKVWEAFRELDQSVQVGHGVPGGKCRIADEMS